MAPVSPPAWMQAGTYSAQMDRQVLAGLLTPAPAAAGALAARPGVKPSNQSAGLRVTQRATPDMWVTVAAGACYIAAASPVGGTYVCANDGPFDLQIAAAHASLARRDLVIARVYDATDDVGADNKYAIEVITGTPASSPVRPTTPGQSLELADVLVPAASTTVVNANISDLRPQTVALGGVLPVGSAAALPAQPYTGQAVYRADEPALRVYDGAAWPGIPFAFSAYTPQWISDGTQPTLGNGIAAGRYVQIGKLVMFFAHIQLGSTSNIGTGYYKTTLPVAPRTGPPHQVAHVWLLDASAGQAWTGRAVLGGTTVTLTVQRTNLDTVGRTIPFDFASGDIISLSGVYEAA